MLYLAASLVLNHRVLGELATATAGRINVDSDLFTWWLHWTPWSLLHGHNPLVTDYQHFPVGVNAMWNTTVPVLGLLLAPLTLTAGPVVAFNIAMILGPVASGVAMAAALTPYTRRQTPRIVAGGLYAFAPFQLAHLAAGHLNLVWSLLPPALLYTVYVLVVRRPRRAGLAGALLGVALAVQTVLYVQTVGLGVLMLVVTAVALALRWPRAVLERLPELARAGLGCVATYAVLCAYPLDLLLAGPARPRGPIRVAGDSSADAANLLVPTDVTHFRPALAGAAGHLALYFGEQGGYVGPAVGAVLLVAVLTARSTTIRLTAAVGSVAFVLSLGPTLVVLGHETGVPLPWRAVMHVPLLSEAEPVRLQAFVTLCVVVVVALWLDRLPDLASVAARGAGGVLAVLALLSWLPANSQGTQPARNPGFVTRVAAYLRPGDVAETYPRISNAFVDGSRPLLWQLASGMAYRTTGGYFIGSDAQHDELGETPSNRYQDGCAALAQGQPAPGAAQATAAGRELRALGVTVVIVVPPPGANAAPLVEWTHRVTGSAGEAVGGAWVFRL